MALVGHLTQFQRFFKQQKQLDRAYQYLTECLSSGVVRNRILALEDKKEVRYELGDGIVAIEQTYPLKSQEEGFFESHKKFVDFQLCVQGNEYIFVGYKKEFEILQEYDESKDLIVYKNPLYSQQLAALHKFFFSSGVLGIFFPDDVHAGGIDSLESKLTPPKKSVLKVPLELLNTI